MRDCHTHRDRVVGAVDQVGARLDVQAHSEQTQRVVGARRHHRGQRIAVGDVLFAHGFRRCPTGPFGLGDYARFAQRRVPIHLADAHRIGDHHRLLTLGRFGVVIQPVLGKVDHDAFTRSRWQYPFTGNDNILAITGQPGIDVAIHAHDFFRAQTETSCDFVERIFAPREHAFFAAE